MDTWLASTSWLLWIVLPWTWVWKYLFKTLLSILLDIYPEVGLLIHMVILFLVFWGPSILFTIAAVPLHNPTNSAQGLILSMSLETPAIFCFLDSSHPIGHKVASFTSTSVRTRSAQHPLICLLAKCTSSLEKCPFRSSAHPQSSYLISCCRVVGALSTFQTPTFIRYTICKYFPQLCRLSSLLCWLCSLMHKSLQVWCSPICLFFLLVLIVLV